MMWRKIPSDPDYYDQWNATFCEGLIRATIDGTFDAYYNGKLVGNFSTLGDAKKSVENKSH